MKNFKKIASLVLVLILAAALVGCSNAKKTETVQPVSPINNPGKSTQPTEVEEFVDKHGYELVEAFEKGFETSGLTCTSEVSANGNAIILDVCLNGIDGLDSSVKGEMQDMFNSMNGEMTSLFEGFKSEIPSLENVTMNILEEDGDFIASIDCNL